MSPVQDYKSLFKHLPLPAVVIDAKASDFTIIEVNHSFQNVFSKPATSALQKPFFDVFPMGQDGLEGKKQLHSFKKVIKTGEPDKTGVLKVNEGDVHNKFKNTKFYELQNIPIKNDHQDVEYIIHTIRDITDEKLKKAKLEENEKRFRSLIENGSDVLFVLDKEGSPKYVSPNIAYVLGYSVEQAMQFKPEDILHPHDIPHVMKELEVALSNPAMPISVTPARMRHKNGSWRWMAGTITNMMHDPAINGIVDNFRDITDKIEAEKRLKESNEKFQSLIQSIDGIFWEADAQTFEFNFVSPQVEEILGYTPEEWLKEDRFWQNRIHPEERKSVIQYCHHETQEGRNHEFEYRIQKADGSYIWVRDVVSVVNKNGKPYKLSGLILDITETKVLQQNLEGAYELSNIGTWELDLINHTLTWSKFVKDLHEVEPDFEPDLESAINFYEEGYSREKVAEAVGNAVEEKIPFDIELTIITAKGNRKWIRAVGEPKIVNGETVAIFGSTQDITSRKQAEIAKEESRRSMQNILDQSMDVICVIDEAGRFERVSTASKHVWGYEPEELEGKEYINYVIPEDRATTRQAASDIMSGVNQTNFENRYRHKNGDIIPIIWAVRWSETDQKMYAVARDARELKEAQKKLRDTEQHLRNIVEHSTNLFYAHDVDGKLTYVSPQSNEFFGYSPEESRRHWEDFVTDHPENYQVFDSTERAINSGKAQPPYELQLKKASGETMWVEVNEAPLVKNGKTVAVVGSLTDITDRKHYQQELKESLERYNYVSKAARDAIYDWNIVDDKLNWGAGFTSLFGYDNQQMNIVSDSWEKNIHPGDKDIILEKMHHTLFKTDKSEFIAEYRLKKSTGEYAYVSDIGHIIRNKAGEPVRMIGAIRDITENKVVEIEKTIQNNLSQIFTKDSSLKDILSETLGYLADFGNYNTSEIWLLNESQTHLNLISTFASDKKGSQFYEESSNIKTFTRGEGLPGMVWKKQENLFWDNIFEPGKYVRFEAASEAGLKSAYGIRLSHKRKFIGVLLLSIDRPLNEQQNSIEQLSSLGEFLGAEIKRRQKEEEHQLLFESAPEIIAVTSQDGKFVSVNPAFCELTGYSEEEITNTPFQEFIHPDDLDEKNKDFKETISDERSADNYVNRWRTKSGEYRWISWNSSDLFGEDNLAFTFGRDVTQTMKLKNLLHQTSELAKIGSWEIILAEKQPTYYWSATTCDIMEVDADYSPSLQENYNYYVGESRDAIEHAVEAALESGNPFDLQLKIKTAKSNEKWVRCKGETEFENGRCIRLFGSLQDITDKVLAEQEILESEQRFRSLVQDSGDIIGILDSQAHFKYITPNTESILNITQKEILGKSVTGFIHPEDLPYIREIIDSIHIGERFETEPFRFQGGNGDWIWVETVITNSLDKPAVNGFIVNSRDVTEKIEREIKLRESVERYEVVSKATSDTIWDMDLATGKMMYNNNIYSMFGFDLDEVKNISEWWKNHIHPEDRAYVNKIFRKAIANRTERLQLEYRFKTKCGDYKYIFDRAFILKDETGEPVRIIGAMQDITQETIEQQKLKLRESVITNTNDTVVITEAEPDEDKNWRKIIYVNDAFERITGYSKEEVLGQSIEILNGPKTDPKEIQKIRDSVDSLVPCEAEILNYTKEGRTFWNNFTLAPVKDKFDKYTHWIIIGRDVSDYKQNEKELKESIKEKETLLAEIHHRVKNNLAIVSSLMQMQAMNSESEELNRQLLESVLRIKSMAGIHEQLYQAQNFSKLQFSDSLKSLSENIVDTLQTDTDVELKLDLESIELNINQSVPCSLLINEVVTNILKHGFIGRDKGTIQIQTKVESDLVTIRIEDNGVGLPDDFDEKKHTSLGLELIDLLSKQLDGENRYVSNGNGTTFELKFQRANVKGAASGFLV